MESMQEAVVALSVLIVGVVIGSFLKPSEAQTRPLYPDEIKGPGSAHSNESAHHHH
jgi:hypothetical protein